MDLGDIRHADVLVGAAGERDARHIHGEARHLAGGELPPFGEGDLLGQDAVGGVDGQGERLTGDVHRGAGEPEVARRVGVQRDGVRRPVRGQGAVLGPIPLTHDRGAEGQFHLAHGGVFQFQVLEGKAAIRRQVREMELHLLRERRGSGGFRDQELGGFVHGVLQRLLVRGHVHAPGAAARADGPGGGSRRNCIEGIRRRRVGRIEGGLEPGRRAVFGGRDGGIHGLSIIHRQENVAVVPGP